MSVHSLGYLGFAVRDLTAWRDFAGPVLGLMEVPSSAGPGTLQFRMDNRAFRVALHQSDVDGLAYVGFDVGSSANLHALIGRLEAAGVTVNVCSPEETAARRVAEAVHLADPAGNRVELFHTPLLDHGPLVSPAGVSGFVTGQGGLGHLVMLAAPYVETKRFYTELLGFRESDSLHLGPVFVEFLHCNARHHSLAIGDAGGANQVLHFMVELSSVDDVGYALDRCRDTGATITMGMGRHANDLMTSFYVQTPSGFEVEVGTGGLLIDDATWAVTEISRPSLWGHRPEIPPSAADPAAMEAAGVNSADLVINAPPRP